MMLKYSNQAANYLPICLQLKRLLIESHSNLDFSQVNAVVTTHLSLSLTRALVVFFSQFIAVILICLFVFNINNNIHYMRFDTHMINSHMRWVSCHTEMSMLNLTWSMSNGSTLMKALVY